MAVKNLFITGTPGVGKTTLIKEVTLPYRDRVAGFYTEEMREGGGVFGPPGRRLSSQHCGEGGEAFDPSGRRLSSQRCGEGGERRGFRVKTFARPGEEPREGLLAEKGLKSPAKVGKYGVSLETLDRLVAETLEKGLETEGALLVIDEIGAMEILSDRFRETLLKCLQSPGHAVLATIRLNAQPFTDELKRLSDTEIVRLSRENYPTVKEETSRWLSETIRARRID
ncbi:MAG: hypothetical protein HY548_03415 [Elusimicrobia bacterium]|nr:hypothetical protein [Elusimicrobiota bacterium]